MPEDRFYNDYIENPSQPLVTVNWDEAKGIAKNLSEVFYMIAGFSAIYLLVLIGGIM